MSSEPIDVPLGKILAALIDYRGKTPTKTESGVKLITAKVIKDGRIADENHEFIAEDQYDAWMRRGLPEQWDILITTEAPLGEVAMLRTPDRVALAQRVILLRADKATTEQKYLFQALKSPLVQARLNARATGTTVLGIKQSELVQVEIPLPPLAKQRRIASILSAYDDLIENNIRRIAILEEIARRIYDEWFVRFRFPGHEKVRMVESELGPVPEGWTLTPASSAIAINPATKVPKEGLKPFIAMNCLSDGSMLIDTPSEREGNSGAKFSNGDTLFARITPCLENGKTGFVQFLSDDSATAFGSTEFIVLRSRTLTPEFVYLLARSSRFRDNAIKSMSGASGRQRVREACFDSFLLANPDGETLAKFESLVRPMFRLVHTLSLKIQNLRATRDLLLPKLISGELDVSVLPEPEGVAA